MIPSGPYGSSSSSSLDGSHEGEDSGGSKSDFDKNQDQEEDDDEFGGYQNFENQELDYVSSTTTDQDLAEQDSGDLTTAFSSGNVGPTSAWSNAPHHISSLYSKAFDLPEAPIDSINNESYKFADNFNTLGNESSTKNGFRSILPIFQILTPLQ